MAKKQEPLPGEMTRGEAADRLMAAIKATDRGIAELAREAGIERPRLSEYANGKRIPSWTRLVRLIEILDLDPNLILPLSVRKKIRKNP